MSASSKGGGGDEEEEIAKVLRNKQRNHVLYCVVFAAFACSQGLVHAWRSKQIGGLQTDIEILKHRLLVVEYGGGGDDHERQRRQVEANNLYEDGVPIGQGRYKTGEAGGVGVNTEGLRIYDAWFQHKNAGEIPKSRNGPLRRRNRNGGGRDSGNAIKPYHRTSAAWVEQRRRKSKHDLNAHFGDKIYRDPYPRRGGSSRGSGRAIDLPQSNRYKITPTTEKAYEEVELNVVSQLPTRRHLYHTRNETTSNKGLVRSGEVHHKKHHHKKQLHSIAATNPIADQFQGLKAVHFVGQVGGPEQRDSDRRVYEGEGNQKNKDGVFRQWAPARWATRMRADEEFPLDNEGRVSVKKSGLYYIYAQINYLDEHDVNAFQVFINEEPYLLCTVMTHTRHQTTKANTCFTSGVAFLEAEDQILVRDLEPMRNSVIRPSHTFFGLIQLSSN